jgi:hypothetical protein
METPMTQLPDGSKCFTATIMSHDEAMALPLKERPLNHRISSEMYHAVFEAIGRASMCWNPRPSGEVFASEQASDVAVRLCFKIACETEKLREAMEKIEFYAATGILQDSFDEIKRIARDALSNADVQPPRRKESQ